MTTPETKASDTVRPEPCPVPWCESDFHRVIRPRKQFLVECQRCGCQGPTGDTEAEAIAAWNTRALSLPKGEEVERPLSEHPCWWPTQKAIGHRSYFLANEVQPDCERCGTLIGANNKQLEGTPLRWERPAALSTKAPAQGDVERIAERIYEAMVWAAEHAEMGKPPAWVPGGNSLAQGEARRAAAALASMSPTLSPKDEGPIHRSDCAIYNEPAEPCDCHLVDPGVEAPTPIERLEHSQAYKDFLISLSRPSPTSEVVERLIALAERCEEKALLQLETVVAGPPSNSSSWKELAQMAESLLRSAAILRAKAAILQESPQ